MEKTQALMFCEGGFGPNRARPMNLQRNPPLVLNPDLAYLPVGRECMAATKVDVCGWKAGTASSVYMPPLCRWFKLTMSVITISPVS